jgi:HD-GYP domain-containing protein (c-di-GMP phosphodiesterase class II)
MSTQSTHIAVQDLPVGQPLACDVLDSSGIVLLRQGLVVTQSVIEGWQRRGFARVLLSYPTTNKVGNAAGTKSASNEDPATRLVQPYDTELVEELNESFSIAKVAIDRIVDRLAVRESPALSVLESLFDGYVQAIHKDDGAVLASAATQPVQQVGATNSALATRSVQMAILGATTASAMGLSSQEIRDIATAGLLHDMSLFQETLVMLQSGFTSDQDKREVLFRHALYSAELFSSSSGLSDVVRLVITQVHEQVDGRGFPRGLPGHHLNVLSRILNIVDAYLTLIEPEQSQPAYVPSDAIAYMVNHTSNGSFDRECMKAFLTAASIYSIGSRVQLDDSRTATVLRSSRSDPLRPIVRIDDASDAIIDLRVSHLNVTRPLLDPAFPHRRRLPKSQMQAVLWQPIY